MVLGPEDLLRNLEGDKDALKQLETLIDGYLIRHFKGTGEVVYPSDGLLETFNLDILKTFLGGYKDKGWAVTIVNYKSGGRSLRFGYGKSPSLEEEIVDNGNVPLDEEVEERPEIIDNRELTEEEELENLLDTHYGRKKKRTRDDDVEDLLR